MEIVRNLINTDLGLIKQFRDDTTSMLHDLDYDDDFIFKIRLILDELIINSYKHGNNKEFDKIIEVMLCFDGDLAVIKVKDEGDGIIYSKERDLMSDHGRGIQLVYTLADSLYVKDNTIVVMINTNEEDEDI